MSAVESIIEMVKRLSPDDRAALKAALDAPDKFGSASDMERFVTEERFSKGRVCPHCGCIREVRKRHRKQSRAAQGWKGQEGDIQRPAHQQLSQYAQEVHDALQRRRHQVPEQLPGVAQLRELRARDVCREEERYAEVRAQYEEERRV